MWSELDDEVLLEEIGRHPALWELSHPLYKDQRLRDGIWSDIAFKVGKPIPLCKKRWRNIKDTYDRKQNRKSNSDGTAKKGKKWALEEKLAFLKANEEHHINFSSPDSSTEMSSPVPDNGLEQNSMAQLSPEIKLEVTGTNLDNASISARSDGITSKIKRHSHEDKVVDFAEKWENEKKIMFKALLAEEDDVDLFFRSLAKTVKKLPQPLQQRAKAETLRIVSRIEAEAWTL